MDFIRLAQNERLPKKQREVFTRHRELMASMRVSKLVLNRLTGLLIDNIVEEKSGDARNHKLAPILDQIKEYAAHAEPTALTVVPRADRRLFKTTAAFDGVVMEVSVPLPPQ